MGTKRRGVFDTIRPIYWISLLFGTLPLRPSGCRSRPLWKNRAYTIYSSLLLFVALVHSSTAPLFVIQMQSFVSNDTSQAQGRATPSTMIITMKIISPLLSSALTLICLFNGLVFVRRGLPDFLGWIEGIDMRLSIVVRSSRRGQLKFSKVLFLYMAVAQFPCAVIYGYTTFKSSLNDWSGIAWSLMMSFFIISGVTAEVQFVNCTYLLYVRFRDINKFLSSYVDKWAVLNWIWDVPKQLPRAGGGVGVGCLRRLPVDKLEVVHRCHKQLCRSVELLNWTYQLVVLVSLFSCFSKHVFNAYFILFGYLTKWNSTIFGKSVSHRAVHPFRLAYSIYWCLLFLVRFLLITLAASYTSTEASSAKSIVSDLNDRYLEPKLKEELALFLNHVSSKQINFSAYGFFKLNKKLIASALTAATTYLVILIQFHPHNSE